jgi:hypothetical protein
MVSINLLAVLAASFFWVPQVFAAANNAPHTMNFSGYLTDSSGNPEEGTYNLRFSLLVSGSVAWCASYESVSVTTGQFSVVLGSTAQGGQSETTSSCGLPAAGTTQANSNLPLTDSLISGVTSSTSVQVAMEIYDGSEYEQLNPYFSVSSALFALQAETVGGYDQTELAKMNSTTGDILSQNGTSVIDPNGVWIGPSMNLGGSGAITGLSTPSSSSTSSAATVGYANSYLDGIAISGSAPSSGQVLSYNGSNWVATSAAAGTVTSVSSGTSTVLTVANSTSTPSISIAEASSVSPGYILASDYTNFIGKVNRSGDTMTGALTVPTVYGSSSASGTLTLDSTSSSTKGDVVLAPSGGNVGIGTATPTLQLQNVGTLSTQTNFIDTGDGTIWAPSASIATLSPSSSAVASAANEQAGMLVWANIPSSNTVGMAQSAGIVAYTTDESASGVSNSSINGADLEAEALTAGKTYSNGIYGSQSWGIMMVNSTVANLNGGWGGTVQTSGTATASYGQSGNVMLSGGTTTSAYGAAGTLQLTGGAVTTRAAALFANGTNDGANIGEQDGLYVINPISAGTVANRYGIHVASSSGAPTGSDFAVGSDSTAKSYLMGKVGIGTNNPSYLLHTSSSSAGAVAGFTNSAGTCSLTPSSSSASFSCTSDERLKKDIEPISGQGVLDRLSKLQAVTYALKKGDNGERHTGYIAQNAQKIAPEFVTQGPDGLLQVSYTGFIPWITEAIKTLYSNAADQYTKLSGELKQRDQEIEALKAENTAIKSELAQAKTHVSEIDARLEALEHQALAAQLKGSQGKGEWASK